MKPLVLFDFGGVVLRTPFELLPDHVTWRGPFGPAGHDDLWDRSVDPDDDYHERDYWHDRSAELHPDADDPTFALMRDLYEVEEGRLVRPEVLGLLDGLVAAGYRVAVLTNDMRRFHGEEWVARMRVLDRFEEVVDLSTIGFLKPSPEAYDHTLRVLDVPASAILFVDDQPPNVEGARDRGIDAVRFDPTAVDASIELVEQALGSDRPPPPTDAPLSSRVC